MSITWLEYARLVKPDIIGRGVYNTCLGCPGDLNKIGAHHVTGSCLYGDGGYGDAICTECWNQKIPYPVIAEAVRDGYYGFSYYVGDKFEITGVEQKEEGGRYMSISTNIYFIPSNGDFKFYIDENYRKGEKEMHEEFTRDDLKDGMMCERRNGIRMLWLEGAMRGYNVWCSGTQYDLTGETNRDNDIVKVGYPDFDRYHVISDALSGNFKEVIWERKEEKEISSDEAFRVLKEHYGCDVKIKEN